MHISCLVICSWPSNLAMRLGGTYRPCGLKFWLPHQPDMVFFFYCSPICDMEQNDKWELSTLYTGDCINAVLPLLSCWLYLYLGYQSIMEIYQSVESQLSVCQPAPSLQDSWHPMVGYRGTEVAENSWMPTCPTLYWLQIKLQALPLGSCCV